MKILGLIPARGGSKGIKNKNLADVGGHPLISYVITALKQADLVDRVLCTTDSPKIAETAISLGAEAPFLRPAELARDDSPTYPALTHAVTTLEQLDGFKPDYIVTTQPTYPLIQSKQIDDAIRLAAKKHADSVITVCELDHDCHPYNIRRIEESGKTAFWMTNEHYEFPTRQSKPKFHKFGNLYVSSYDTVVNQGKLEGDANYAIVIDALFSLDVNTKEDLSIIETVLKNGGPTNA